MNCPPAALHHLNKVQIGGQGACGRICRVQSQSWFARQGVAALLR